MELHGNLPMSEPSDERTTPSWLYEPLHKALNFQIDSAATAENTKCERYYTIETNGLGQPWHHNTFCNPPYSRGQIQKWINKAALEVIVHPYIVVCMILPGDFSTNWYQDCLWYKADILFQLGKRVNFHTYKEGAFFPTLIALFGNVSLPINFNGLFGKFIPLKIIRESYPDTINSAPELRL
jgi:phage N-6-adenine-methyltransferase